MAAIGVNFLKLRNIYQKYPFNKNFRICVFTVILQFPSTMPFLCLCNYRYTTVPFNKTLPLFGPRTWRHDDYKDQENYIREPTRTVVTSVDSGAGRATNYTHDGHKMNPW